ncbi:hypothetical protein ACFFGH_17470 [Lysobacter korlensis]|uniref:Uncharacterized protein n=1 Tax=Lysobacter korlensis TaxID=553636 RepID=A0ABV6RRM3_9GAMM
MNFDDMLRDAWHHEAPHPRLADLTARVLRQQRLRHAQRIGEVALTLAAALVFARAFASGAAGPGHWLLLPFFVVFLPVAWVFALRSRDGRNAVVAESMHDYARLRLAQLRLGLRDLSLARTAAVCLLGYATVAVVAAGWIGAPEWRSGAVALLAYASAWAAGTWWLSRRLRARWVAEYRSVRRLLSEP